MIHRLPPKVCGLIRSRGQTEPVADTANK